MAIKLKILINFIIIDRKNNNYKKINKIKIQNLLKY